MMASLMLGMGMTASHSSGILATSSYKNKATQPLASDSAGLSQTARQIAALHMQGFEGIPARSSVAFLTIHSHSHS
jgi:hypothetical protein